MELSKEQIKLLKLAKTNDIPIDADYYYSNDILQDLIYQKGLIETKSKHIDEDLLPFDYNC